MSRDIRAFFKIDSSKKRKPSAEPENSAPNKKAALRLSDDEDDGKAIKKEIKRPKKRIIEDSSDEEVTKSKSKKNSSPKKEVKKSKPIEVKDLKNLFGGPVKRTERSKESKTSPTNGSNESNGHSIETDIAKVDLESLKKKKEVSDRKDEKHKTNGHHHVAKESPKKSPEKKRREEKVSPKKSPKIEELKKKSPEKSPIMKEVTPKKSSKVVKQSPKKDSPKKKSSTPPPLMKIITNDKSLSKDLKKSSLNEGDWIVTKKSEPKPSNSTIDKPKPIAMKPMSPIKRDIIPVDINTLSFVDKYKPQTVKEIIGQQGPSSNANKLQNWLLHWHKNHNDPKKKAARPNPYAKNDDGSAFKAALLSGMPGIGKTTTAHLVSKELQFDIVEFNASDTRSKRLLKEEVQQLLSNQSLKGYASGEDKGTSKRHVLIMDEVDGMSGNEDRGGVAELIQLIKESHIPVICMCNDRNNPKMRSLANHCFDLRFHKPTINQIRGSMMSICFKEGLKMEAGAIDSIINGTGSDIRQTLNHLALYSASKDQKLGAEAAKKTAELSEKDVKIGPWDVIRKVFSADEHKTMNFNDKSDLFFYDYNIAPLFVQENYLHVKPKAGNLEVLERVAKTADSISLGDIVDKKIRSNQAWSLLPTMAVFSSVLPGEHMSGSFTAPVNFPSWLGKNSNANKKKRLAQEVHDHTRIATSGSRMSVRLDYAQFLVKVIVKPLIDKGMDGVPEALEIIKSYHLLREDLDSLFELTTWGGAKSPWDKVESKVKAALTRTYNKEVQPYSFSAQADVKKKKNAATFEDEFGMENDDAGGNQSDDEEEDSIEKSSMIKVKKPAAASKAGTSKGGEGTSKKSSASTSKSQSKAKSVKK